MKCTVGIDPGAVTGVGVWSGEGLCFSWQDNQYDALRRLIFLLKGGSVECVLVAIESAFLGKGPAASLSVAASAGHVEGALWCSGYPTQSQGRVWRPKPSEWRAVHGFRRTRDEAEEDARSYASAHAEKEFPKSNTHEAEAIAMASAAWETMMGRKLAREMASTKSS